ncbi:MAG: hypothetical protein ACYDEX_21015 [Mobilitalea sp.]
MIPSKSSKKWIVVFLIFTIVVFFSFLITRLVLDSDVLGRYLFGLIMMSVSSAFIPCIAGYLGRRVFFIVDTIFIVLGILYMFYVVLGNTAPGWGDLTSIIGYLFIVLLGVIIASIAEIINYFITKRKNK